jgi:hypothetical protein
MNQADDATHDMGKMPELLGAMLVRTTFIVATLVFIAFIYIRGLVLVSEHVIGYPILIIVITIMLCVFICAALGGFSQSADCAGNRLFVALYAFAITAPVAF